MTTLRYLGRSLNAFNLILLVAITLVFFFVVRPLFWGEVRYTLPQPKRLAGSRSAPLPDTATNPPSFDYGLIAEANLFHPERRIPPEKKEQKVLPRPELILYGTVVTGAEQLAFIEDKRQPRTSEGRGKRQSVIKKGDVVGGFVLTEIAADSIRLARGEETMVVRLTEAGKQRGGGNSQETGKPTSTIMGPVPVAASPATTPNRVTSPASPATASSVPTGSSAAASQPRRQVLWRGNVVSVPGF